jgi:flagellar hook-length control protein FliK
MFDGNESEKQGFSEIIENLENALHQNFQESRVSAPQQPGQTANAQNAHSGSMSTMLEQMENIERLSEAMKMATKGGVNNITMQLAPAELGRLVLKVESRNGVVSAKLRVEKKEAAEQLGANLHALKKSLAALGITLGDIDIEHEPATESPGDFLEELAARSDTGRETAGETDGLSNLFA